MRYLLTNSSPFFLLLSEYPLTQCHLAYFLQFIIISKSQSLDRLQLRQGHSFFGLTCDVSKNFSLFCSVHLLPLVIGNLHGAGNPNFLPFASRLIPRPKNDKGVAQATVW